VENQPIVVLGGSEDDRAAIVSQLSGSGLAAQGVTKLTAADGLPGLIVIVGDAVVRARHRSTGRPGAGRHADPRHRAADAAADARGRARSSATDVIRTPAPSALLVARCRNMLKLSRRDGANAQALTKINDVLTCRRRRCRGADSGPTDHRERASASIRASLDRAHSRQRPRVRDRPTDAEAVHQRFTPRDRRDPEDRRGDPDAVAGHDRRRATSTR
jgi:hypothetical protein